ncbi:MAG: DUF2079 domain-containing protein [Clostridia bacterium]|nr:DUF2079 domain-containing protein [Clostridia bacterium]
MTDFFKNKLQTLTCKNIVTKLIIAIIAVSLVETAFSPYNFNTSEYFISINFTLHLLATVGVFLLLFFTLDEKLDGYILISLLVCLFLLTNYQSKSVFFALLTSLVIGGFVFYFSEKLSFPQLSKKLTLTFTIILASLFVFFVGGITIAKYLSHRTPNFDFGIFSQMYHYMANTFVPYTTCERDILLSHFAVHFSPILYIALPIYWLFPNPSTILAVQAIAVALGAIPLYKLSKHFVLSNNKTLAFIIMYVLHPTVVANNFYYFHENCFLTVMLLWLFYFAEKKKTIPTFIFALLTMMVKEDAPIYVLFFGLYLIFSNKGKIKGALLGALSAIYFSVVTKLMSIYGQGIMTYRYDNFLFESDGSIYDVVLNVIKNPSYVFTQLLSVEKIEFLILMLVPLAFLPFAIKKPSGIILLFPMVLINLMTDYVYQYDIGFQYTYASIAFLFYLAVINASELSPKVAKNLLLCGICASLIFFTAVNLYRIDAFETLSEEKDEIKIINTALDTIPKDASIKSTTFFIPALWNRDEVYEIAYTDEKTDYAVFDLRWNNKEHNEFLKSEADGFEVTFIEEGVIAIYKAK